MHAYEDDDDMEGFVLRLRQLAKEARWLDAIDELEQFEAVHQHLKSSLEAQELIDDVRDVGQKFRSARMQCAEDGGIEWEQGHSYLGTKTSFRYDDGGRLWLKTEGEMKADIYYTVAVIREVELFNEWVPFVRSVSKLKEIDFSRLCTHFSIGVRGILVRDCVLRVSACNNALSDGSLYFEGQSPAEDLDSWHGTQLPPRRRGFAFDRMHIIALNARIEFVSPDAQRCKIIVAVDLRLSVPRTLLDFFLKRLVGIFLILWRRQARIVADHPDCKHRLAIDTDTAFYRDFLNVKYAEFIEERGWRIQASPQCDTAPLEKDA